MYNLYRWNCPSTQDIGHYYLNLLTTPEAEKIAAHLKTCIRCQAEYRTLADFMADDTPDALPLEPDSLTLATAHQPTSLRLMEAKARSMPSVLEKGFRASGLTFEADNTTVSLHLKEGAAGMGLLGQVLTPNQADWVGAVVELRQPTGQRARAVIDENGEFFCEEAPHGTIELRITSVQGRHILLKGIELAM